MKDVSIIIITSNRLKFLERLISQIKDQFIESEVIVVVNNDHQNYDDIQKNFDLKMIKGTYKTPGVARNHGIKAASRDWLLFLDDDTELPEGFSKRASDIIHKVLSEVSVLGGPDQSPPKATIPSKILNLTLTSPMATAHTRLRHTNQIQNVKKGHESNLILCNLWVRRKFILDKEIQFNESLFRNEENLFITQAVESGAQVEYHPDLFIYHHRKTRLDKLFKAVFSSGKHRVKSTLFSRNLLSPLFLIPGGLVAYLLLLPVIKGFPYAMIPLKVYITLSILISLKVGSGIYWLGVLFYQIFINIGYGFGVLYGLVCLPFWLLTIRR